MSDPDDPHPTRDQVEKFLEPLKEQGALPPDEPFELKQPVTSEDVKDIIEECLKGILMSKPNPYTVICDRRNNSQEDIDQGKLNVRFDIPRDTPLYNDMMAHIARGDAYLDGNNIFRFTEAYLRSLD